MSEGWIKLHRKILNWEWFDDDKTFKLFIFLILSANIEDKKWKGLEVKRGQLITSVSHLAESLKFSSKNIRTRLNQLKSTNEVAINTTTQYTLITINNYDEYQEVANEKANQGQTTGKRLATTKEYKNKKNNTYSSPNYLLTIPKEDLRQISKDIGVTEREILLKGKQLHDYCEAKGKKYKNYKAFLRNCLRSDGDKKQNLQVDFLKGANHI